MLWWDVRSVWGRERKLFEAERARQHIQPLFRRAKDGSRELASPGKPCLGAYKLFRVVSVSKPLVKSGSWFSPDDSTLGASRWHLCDCLAHLARSGRSGFNHLVLHVDRFIADGLARLTTGCRCQQNSQSCSDANS